MGHAHFLHFFIGSFDSFHARIICKNRHNTTSINIYAMNFMKRKFLLCPTFLFSHGGFPKKCLKNVKNKKWRAKGTNVSSFNFLTQIAKDSNLNRVFPKLVRPSRLAYKFFGKKIINVRTKCHLTVRPRKKTSHHSQRNNVRFSVNLVHKKVFPKSY